MFWHLASLCPTLHFISVRPPLESGASTLLQQRSVFTSESTFSSCPQPQPFYSNISASWMRLWFKSCYQTTWCTVDSSYVWQSVLCSGAGTSQRLCVSLLAAGSCSVCDIQISSSQDGQFRCVKLNMLLTSHCCSQLAVHPIRRQIQNWDISHFRPCFPLKSLKCYL